MIRIELGAEVKRRGRYAYSCPSHGAVRGFSRQPLLDACRQLKSLYGVTAARVGLFREGSDVAAISCSVDVGAVTAVVELDKGTVMFQKYVALPMGFRPEVRARP